MFDLTALTGKTAVVSGASQGIGQAITAALVAKGVHVVTVGRSRARLERALNEMAAGDCASCVEADLSQPTAAALVTEHLAAMDRAVDILVNCAAVYAHGSWADATPAGFENVFETNVLGVFALTKALLPQLIRQRGDVVFVNSSIVNSSGQDNCQYAASKHALRSLADSLRSEVNDSGVRVLSVYPGRTATPMQESIVMGEQREYRPDRLLQASDVADLVVACLALPATAEVTDVHLRPRYKS